MERPRRTASAAGSDKIKTSTLPRALVKELETTSRKGAVADAVVALEKALQARDEGRTPAAIRAAERAKEAAPRSATVRDLLGTLHHRSGAWHAAAQELLAGRRMSGNRARDPLIAACYRNAGEPARALTFLADLTPGLVPAEVWMIAQIERARAYAATGRATIGIELLRNERRGAIGPKAQLLERALEEIAAP